MYGILKFSWYINEIAALFLGLGIISGLLGRLSLSEIADSLKEGARDMVGVALIIGCARAILVVATDGKILDMMLYSMASITTQLHPVFAAQAMFVVQGIINFFVHSGSGQAALTMPIMAPLADVIGITRQTAVLAFQFGEGWINPILPTSGVTMGVLGLAGISYDKWFKWMLPIQIYFFIVALLLMIPPVLLFFYGPH
ncbi:MAG: TIGR00366 family protein [Ignavibacteria bacterium]|nr:TIGR00366 family protein [Ignavibacteria bacterium]